MTTAEKAPCAKERSETGAQTVAELEARIVELRSKHERAADAWRVSAAALANAVADGAPEPERQRLRRDVADLADRQRELIAGIALLASDLVPAREIAKEAAISLADSEAIIAVGAYQESVAGLEELTRRLVREQLGPQYDRMQAAALSARELHFAAVRVAGRDARLHPFEPRLTLAFLDAKVSPADGVAAHAQYRQSFFGALRFLRRAFGNPGSEVQRSD